MYQDNSVSQRVFLRIFSSLIKCLSTALEFTLSVAYQSVYLAQSSGRSTLGFCSGNQHSSPSDRGNIEIASADLAFLRQLREQITEGIKRTARLVPPNRVKPPFDPNSRNRRNRRRRQRIMQIVKREKIAPKNEPQMKTLRPEVVRLKLMTLRPKTSRKLIGNYRTDQFRYCRC